MEITDEIKEIAYHILDQIAAEKSANIDNESIGRADIVIKDKPKQIWITRKQYPKNRVDNQDIKGNYIGGEFFGKRSVLTRNNAFWRNSELIKIIIQKKLGVHKTTRATVQVDTFAHYVRDNYDATGGEIYV